MSSLVTERCCGSIYAPVCMMFAIAGEPGYVDGMSENTEVILWVTFINGILYSLFERWKLRRAANKERDASAADKAA